MGRLRTGVGIGPAASGADASLVAAWRADGEALLGGLPMTTLLPRHSLS
jgi:hypothetical protein